MKIWEQESALQHTRNTYIKERVSRKINLRDNNTLFKPEILNAADSLKVVRIGELNVIEKRERKIFHKILESK